MIDRARSNRAAASAKSLLFNVTTPLYQIGQPQWPDGDAASYAKAYRSQAAVYACVQRRANGVSQAPLRVYKDSKGDTEEQPDHPLRALLAAPNPLVSEAEFHVTTVTQMDAVGFAAIEIERSSVGRPVGLWHLRPDWLRMIPQDQAPATWEYRVPGRQPQIIPASDIIIISGGPSTDLKPMGMSPIAVAFREVGINDSATDFLKIFLDTGGVPRYALQTDKVINDEAKATAIRERWSQVYGGYRNWSQVALLHSGLKVTEVGANLDGIAYPSLRALLETHICSVFGVPPILIGIQAGLDASTYSNYEQARKAFFEDTVSTLWDRVAGALGRALLSEFGATAGYSLAFDKSGVIALQEDATAKWDRADKAVKSGWVTVNQAQSIVGLPGFGPSGDVLLMPFSVQPTKPSDLTKLADEAANPPEPVPAALAGAAADPEEGDDEEDDAAPPKDDDEDDEDDADRSIQLERIFAEDSDFRGETLGLAGYSDVRTVPLETRSRIVLNNRRNMTRIAAQYTPQLRALFAAQGEEVAAAYSKRSAADVERRDLDDLADLLSQHEAAMQSLLTGLYQRSGRLSYTNASNVIGVNIVFDLSNPYVRHTQRDLARRVVGINATTRKDIASVVTDGIAAGKAHKDIAADLRGLYAETYRNRSLTIARTESQVAYNLGTADAYKASGRVLAMILHDNPAHTEPYGASDGMSCAERNGVITDVDAVQRHIYAEHPNGQLAASPLLVRPLGSP